MLFYENLREFIEGQKRKLEKLTESNLPEKGLVLKVLKSVNEKSSATQEIDELELNYLGIYGDRHYRSFRKSSGREKTIYPKGTLIREHRHIVAVSLFDCRTLSYLLGVEVTPELLGANIVIEREDGKDFSLSETPENTYLLITQQNTEVFKPPISTLKHYTLQQGCGITGRVIADHYKNEKLTQNFILYSKFNRGIICSIEYPVDKIAKIKAGQSVFFKFPQGITP